MLFIYIRTVIFGKKRIVPYQVAVTSLNNPEDKVLYNFRPDIAIPKRIYELNKLNRLEILNFEPFCNIVDELIDIFKNETLVFSENTQFRLLKSLFSTIGYNFNIKPEIVWRTEVLRRKAVDDKFDKYAPESEGYLDFLYNRMAEKLLSRQIKLDNYKNHYLKNLDAEVSGFATKPGVYFFLNSSGTIIYVGKAKNIRKRLQSHFSNKENTSTIDYSKVATIEVKYTGNDIIAQLIETENIKSLQPIYNIQQIEEKAPFVMYLFKTAKGISRIKISRKETQDNFPEKYFNRNSVKKALLNFCEKYNLCRKYCGIETTNGGCSRTTQDGLNCVCNRTEPLSNYNERFKDAVKDFESKKSKKIYKLPGRSSNEDAFVYLVNDIYEGYGFIDKNEIISSNHDILNHLNVRENNYETARIVAILRKSVSQLDIVHLK